MGELLNDFTKYLCEVLAMNVEPEPWEGEAVLPLYLREQYQFHQANSDIDFLVEMEPGRSLFDLGGLLMDLEQLLNTKVDVVTERGLKERIRERVLNEAIPL